jgi:glutathione S-transferase
MALTAKGEKFELQPRTKTNKEEWLMAEPYNGTLPCLRAANGEWTVVDSKAIIKFIDDKFDDVNSLSHGWATHEALGFFLPCMKFMKNTDIEKDSELERSLATKLDELNALLAKSSGDFIVGDKVSVADCFTAPLLYFLETVLPTLKQKDFSKMISKRPALAKYVNFLQTYEPYTKGAKYFTPSDILDGLKAARKA